VCSSDLNGLERMLSKYGKSDIVVVNAIVLCSGVNLSNDSCYIIDEVDRLVSHDIAPLHGTCSECKVEVRLPMKNAVDMVLPFRSEERSIRHRIHFGKGAVLSRD
jgi:hypothetical protein